MTGKRLKSGLSFLLMVALALCALNVLFADRYAAGGGSGERTGAEAAYISRKTGSAEPSSGAPADTESGATVHDVAGALLGWDAPGYAGDLPACPEAVDLVGKLDTDSVRELNMSEAELAAAHADVSALAQWAPRNCTARSRVAFVVPYRDRESHLTRLLHFLIPVLQRQMIDFRFIVVEQLGAALFNKGRLLNAAFTLAQLMPVDCVVFHDVDMLPQYDTHLYHCPRNGLPIHHGAYVDVLKYRLFYDHLVGGVTAFTLPQYRQVNGHSNSYWGYGGEDDDLGLRIMKVFGRVERPPPNATGRYTMLGHGKRRHSAYKEVLRLIKSAKGRMADDGLAQGDWRIVRVTRRPLYYHMMVDVGHVPAVWIGGSVEKSETTAAGVNTTVHTDNSTA